MKNIWIFNHYATNMYIDKGGRHYWLAQELIKLGYQCTIFCASTIHNSNGTQIDMQRNKYIYKTENNINFVFIKTPPYKGNGSSRIKNMLSFSFQMKQAALRYGDQFGYPDIILASSVHPFTCVAGILLAKRLKKPCVIEIRDLWPESIVEYQKKSKKNIVIRMFYYMERWIYKKADKIIFTMPGGWKYICEKGWDNIISATKIININNGVCLDDFDINKEMYQISDFDLTNPNLFKIIYTGSIRMVNHLDEIIDVAKVLKDKGDNNILIMIYGDGDEKRSLEERSKKLKLDNIIFKGSVEKKYIPYIVSMADANLLHVKKTGIMRFGYSMNKVFDYYAARKPVISNLDVDYDMIEAQGCGITLKEDSVERYAEIFLEMASKKGSKEYLNYCERSRELSKQYCFNSLAKQFIEVFERL